MDTFFYSPFLPSYHFPGGSEKRFHAVAVSHEPLDGGLGQTVDRPGQGEGFHLPDQVGRRFHEADAQSGNPERFGHGIEHHEIGQLRPDQADRFRIGSEWQIGFVDDEYRIGKAAAQGLDFRPAGQRTGGVVGVAQKDQIGPAGRAGNSLQVGCEVVGFPADQMFAGHPIHGAGILIVGIGGADHQGPFGFQGAGDSVDQFGGAVAGHDRSGVDAMIGGKGLYNAAGIHFGQGRDGWQVGLQMIEQRRHGAEGIDVGAHVADVRRPAVQLTGQLVDVATVAADHDAPPAQTARKRKASRISVMAPSRSPVIPFRRSR